jgi:phage-related protein
VRIAFYKSSSGRSPIEDEIKKLSAEDKARFAEVIEGIEAHGFECPRVVFKPLRGKLWEVKFSTSRGGYRVAYVMATKEVMVWLHMFQKKTQKTPYDDLKLAEKRMKEVL